MKRVSGNVFLAAIAVTFTFLGNVSSAQATDTVVPQVSARSFRGLVDVPVFTRNLGQWDDRVLFMTKYSGATVWFCKDCVVHQFSVPQDRCQSKVFEEEEDREDTKPILESSTPRKNLLVKRFVGSTVDPDVIGEKTSDYRCNYFIGRDREHWRTNVPNYEAILYRGIYPGVDLRYRFNKQRILEYDIILHPGANPMDLIATYDGATDLCIDDTGALHVEGRFRDIIEQNPRVFQHIDGNDLVIPARFAPIDSNSFKFEVGDQYRSEYALSIDPAIEYSTYLGGEAREDIPSIAVDDQGSIFLTTATEGTNFPLKDPYQSESYAGCDETSCKSDAVIARLSSSGNNLIFSTYLGGVGHDAGIDIALDSDGDPIVLGVTYSPEFPVTTLFGSSETLQGTFVAKFTSDGDSLIFSSILCGSGGVRPTGLDLDQSENIYLTGTTWSHDFPLRNPFSAEFSGEYSPFVSKISASGDSLVYSTYLGAQGRAQDIAVDSDGCAYVAGYTSDENFPSRNAFQPFDYFTLPATFLTKLNAAGDDLVYSTAYDGRGGEAAHKVAVDAVGQAYMVGETDSPDLPVRNAVVGSYGGWDDAFVVEFNTQGDDIIYSTYLGGSHFELGFALDIDDEGRAVVGGLTLSDDFPTKFPLQEPQPNESSAFISIINAGGGTLAFSTHFGGYTGYDELYSIAVGCCGDIYFAGVTNSTDYPVVSPFQPALAGDYNPDCFVTKLSFSPTEVSSVDDATLPTEFRLEQNYPNPFNPGTAIEFSLPKQAHIRLSVFNTLGERIALLADEVVPAGKHQVRWDGLDERGERAASGVYFYKLTAGNFEQTRKMILLR